MAKLKSVSRAGLSVAGRSVGGNPEGWQAIYFDEMRLGCQRERSVLEGERIWSQIRTSLIPTSRLTRRIALRRVDSDRILSWSRCDMDSGINVAQGSCRGELEWTGHVRYVREEREGTRQFR